MNQKARALLNSDWSQSFMTREQRARQSQRIKEQRIERLDAARRAKLAAIRDTIRVRFFETKQTAEQIANDLGVDIDEVKRLINRMRA